MSIYESLAQEIQRMAGQSEIFFDEAVRVKPTPHNRAFSAWGVCVSPSGAVGVMDFNMNWFPVEDAVEDEMLVNSLYQRIKLIQNRQVA